MAQTGASSASKTFEELAESAGLKPKTIETLKREDFDSVESIKAMREEDATALSLTRGQFCLLRKWKETLLTPVITEPAKDIAPTPTPTPTPTNELWDEWDTVVDLAFILQGCNMDENKTLQSSTKTTRMSGHEGYIKSALSSYRNADLAKRDIMTCIQQYVDLRPVRDTFVFNDGTRKELLCLGGTIPVTYKGHTYNIPVCLWILDTHPYNPPMAYVKPTSTMQIKPGKHVDTNGRIYLPCLHDWKHPQSDLLGLVEVLVIMFGDEPPVFAKGHAPPPRQP